PVAREIALNRRIDHLGELTSAEPADAFRAELRGEPRENLFSRQEDTILFGDLAPGKHRGGRRRVSVYDLQHRLRRRYNGRFRFGGTYGWYRAARQPGDTGVERGLRRRFFVEC